MFTRLSRVLSEDGAILGFDCISKVVIVRFLLTHSLPAI